MCFGARSFAFHDPAEPARALANTGYTRTDWPYALVAKVRRCHKDR